MLSLLRIIIMDSWIYYALSFCAVIIYICHKYFTRNNGYWKSRGIPEAKGAVLFFGHMKDVFLMKKNIGALLENIYNEHPNDSMLGIYEFQKPVLMVRHPDLVKFMLQTEFSSFSDHQEIDRKLDPLLFGDPFFLNGQEWKDSRSVFVNSFSGKKIKDMTPLVKDVALKFQKYMDAKIPADNGTDVEMKPIFSKFTAAVSANVILGIDAQTFVDKDPPASLRSMMDTMFNVDDGYAVKTSIMFFMPVLAKILSTGMVPKWINDGFQKIVDDVISVRDKDGIPRKDILQLIIDDLKEKNEPVKYASRHAFSFFVETYESSSLTLSAMSYFLAKYPEVQDNAREQVEKIFEHHKELSYEALTEMTYLEQITRETLRILPVVGRLHKLCSKPVTLEGPDGLTCDLKKGDQVIIPVFGLQKDPEFWDNPEDFIPERFDKSNDGKHNRYVYLPFGEGPRMCPGMRFGIHQIKAAMAMILMNYVLEPSRKMRDPFRLHPKYFLSTVEGGYWVKMRRRSE